MRFPITLVVFALGAPLMAAPESVTSFVNQRCVGCHNAKVKSADVDLTIVKDAKSFEADRVIWEKVVEKLKTGQMPPPAACVPISHA